MKLISEVPEGLEMLLWLTMRSCLVTKLRFQALLYQEKKEEVISGVSKDL